MLLESVRRSSLQHSGNGCGKDGLRDGRFVLSAHTILVLNASSTVLSRQIPKGFKTR